MNLVAYDDEYDSLETVEFELDNIGNIVNRSISPDVLFAPGCTEKIDNLIRKFHEKLQKVGSYNVKHSEPVQKFLDHIHKYVSKPKEKSPQKPE
jgi:hypothetical protein